VDKAGKTTLLERLKTMYGDLPGTDPDKILPTVGLNVGRMQVPACRQHCQPCSPLNARPVLGAVHARLQHGTCLRLFAAMQAHQAPLIFWDLGGQAGLRSIWDKYYAESHAILYVVDSSATP
jgi:ADP-ribosylation factor related protein 1